MSRAFEKIHQWDDDGTIAKWSKAGLILAIVWMVSVITWNSFQTQSLLHRQDGREESQVGQIFDLQEQLRDNTDTLGIVVDQNQALSEQIRSLGLVPVVDPTTTTTVRSRARTTTTTSTTVTPTIRPDPVTPPTMPPSPNPGVLDPVADPICQIANVLCTE